MATWISPAKLNLYLAVTGIREADGFHELDSLVVQLDFGDELTLNPSPDATDHFHCNVQQLEWNPDNLVHRALSLYRSLSGFEMPLSLDLHKRIPLGSGLGGGSSNASTLLKTMNTLNPNPLPLRTLQEASAALGSDCPLFFAKGLVRMSGRGERIETIEGPLAEQLRGRSVLVFHPGFPISAAWAYQTLRKGYPNGYTPLATVDHERQRWLQGDDPWTEVARNDLSPVVDCKYLAIPALRQILSESFGLPCFLSGSGSACFAWMDSISDLPAVRECIRKCWGREAFIEECQIQAD